MKQIESAKLTCLYNIVTANLVINLTINITLPMCVRLHVGNDTRRELMMDASLYHHIRELQTFKHGPVFMAHPLYAFIVIFAMRLFSSLL